MTRRKTESVEPTLAKIVSRPEQAECLLEAGLNSAFAIARGGVERLQALAPGLGAEDARTLHQRASALAVLAARQYREQRLCTTQAAAPAWRTGVRALVEGPTFESQFSPSWGDNCTPGAIEATTSPAAYLAALYQWVTEVIEPQADPDKAIPLAIRRPDLPGLLLDNQSLSQVVPTLDLVNEILENAVRKHLDDHNERQRSVDDALLEARYPFGLPFERYMSQINRVLARKDLGLGDLVRRLDPAFPYFSQGGLHSLRSDDALQMDLAVGPEQRGLLLEAAYFPRGARRLGARSVQTRVSPRTLLRESAYAAQSSFYERHYGVQGMSELLDLTQFCQRTGLDRAGVESLLSIETCAPLASPHVVGLAPASAARYGSVYINAGQEPVLGIASTGGEHQLSNATDDHFDRIQRMVRLSRWLELPFDETDRIIDAALFAEHGDAGRGAAISENTLRALGLFRRLRRDFKVRAEDFAAVLNGVALYGRGTVPPQFDRVFNDPALFSEPLVLDDSAFNVMPANDDEHRKILHLCGALGIGFETYLYVARYLVQSRADLQQISDGEGDILHWSHEVISAFYRLTRLAAWIGLTSIEVIALLQLMGLRGHQYVGRLITPTLSVFQHSDLSDTLSVVQALTDAVQWCQENEVTVSWLYQRLMPLKPMATASERERDLLGQIHTRMLPTIITQATFIEAGVPMVFGVDQPTAIDWFDLLKTFLSGSGLIHDIAEYDTSAAFEEALNARINVIIVDLELPQGADVLIKVSSLVMDARAAQQSLVWESLASTFGGSAELSRELLLWAGGTCFQLLDEVLRIHQSLQSLGLPETGVDVMADVLALLARLDERAAIVEAFSLSPLAVRSYLHHPHWFGVEPTRGTGALPVIEVDFRQLHALAQYRHLIGFARQPEQSILDYLALVDELPPDLGESDLQLIREDAAGKVAAFTGFGIRDTLDTAREVTDNGILYSVMHLDHLVRIRGVCETLQLSMSAVISLSRLLSNSQRNHFREAAASAVSSLTAHREGVLVLDEGELGQSETCWIVVDHPRLVAQSGQVAKCLLTVKNFFGQPVEGVSVTWETDLGQLGTVSSGTTNAQGQVDVELLPGALMGTAQVVARFGLDRQVQAPLILIDCDDQSLYFRDPVVTPQTALAGNLGEIVYSVQLLDTYQNPGRDRVVEWSTNLGTFDNPQTRADADGMLTARLRSLSSGTAQVVADVRSNGEQEKFDAVEFVEQPYFQYVRFAGTVATTQPAMVSCRIVNLDGTPVEGALVSWKADQGGFVESPAQSQTGPDGIARIQYLTQVAGKVQVSVDARVDGQTLQTLTSDPVDVYELPRMVYSDPAQQYFVVYQSRPARYVVGLSPEAAGYPVSWYSDGKLLGTTYTQADGRAHFQNHFTVDQMGEQTITARSIREDDQVEFKVSVVKAHTELLLAPMPDSPGLLDLGEGAFAADRGLVSRLSIRALRSDGSGDSDCRLTLSLAGGATPESLGIVLDQPIGEPVDCDERGEIILTIDCSEAAFLPNSDPYGNEIAIQISSNLGVTRELFIRLRELVDLEACEIRCMQRTSQLVSLSIVHGYLRRTNQNQPITLRDDARALRVSINGGEHQENALMLHEQRAWFGNYFTLDPGPEPVCTFEAAGGLQARLHFISANRALRDDEVFEDVQFSLVAETSDGLIEDGHEFAIDSGGTYRFTANLTSRSGPFSNFELYSPLRVDDGVTCRSDGRTDEHGNFSLTVETTRAATGARSFPLVDGMNALSLKLEEFAIANVTIIPEQNSTFRARLNCTALEGRPFSNQAWTGRFSVSSGSTFQFRGSPVGDSFHVTSPAFSPPLPAELSVRLSFPTTNLVRLIGDLDHTIPALLDNPDAEGDQP